MAYEILMPKLSSTMDVGTITMWLKKEGDHVDVGEAIFEVMTDKIAIEVESYDEGILLKKYIGDNESAPVNSVIGYIGTKGEEVPVSPPINDDSTDKSEDIVEKEIKSEEPLKKVINTFEGIRATPAARRLARKNSIELEKVTGTGPRGRIQYQDILNFNINIRNEEEPKKENNYELKPWSSIRKIISDNMLNSKKEIPHVTMTATVNMTEIVNLRNKLLPMVDNETSERLSYLELFTKATAHMLKKYPIFNSRTSSEGIYQYKNVNIGIAVALEDGLVVPVIKDVEYKGIVQLTKETKALTKKARENNLSKEDLSESTFTISSLGKSKVTSFTPIINYPEVSILGIGGMYQKQEIIINDGQMEVLEVPTIELSLSFDHRVVDGAPASQFLSELVEVLENPISLLL